MNCLHSFSFFQFGCSDFLTKGTLCFHCHKVMANYFIQVAVPEKPNKLWLVVCNFCNIALSAYPKFCFEMAFLICLCGLFLPLLCALICVLSHAPVRCPPLHVLSFVRSPLCSHVFAPSVLSCVCSRMCALRCAILCVFFSCVL